MKRCCQDERPGRTEVTCPVVPPSGETAHGAGTFKIPRCRGNTMAAARIPQTVRPWRRSSCESVNRAEGYSCFARGCCPRGTPRAKAGFGFAPWGSRVGSTPGTILSCGPRLMPPPLQKHADRIYFAYYPMAYAVPKSRTRDHPGRPYIPCARTPLVITLRTRRPWSRQPAWDSGKFECLRASPAGGRRRGTRH